MDDSKVGKEKNSVDTEEKVGGGTTPLPGAQDSWLRECQDSKGDTATKLPDLVDAPERRLLQGRVMIEMKMLQLHLAGEDCTDYRGVGRNGVSARKDWKRKGNCHY